MTKANSYENTPGPGAAPVEIAGTFNRQFGNYAKYRGLFGGWKYHGLDALADGTLHPQPADHRSGRSVVFNAPPVNIPSVTYLDLTVGYDAADEDSHSGGHDQPGGQAAADFLSEQRAQREHGRVDL